MGFAGDVLDLAEFADVQDAFRDQGWTDGLPIVPPTPVLVQAMLDGASLMADTDLGFFIEGNVSVDGEALALAAAMAGCKPEYMPVLVAVVKAILKPEFGLMSVQASTSAGVVLTIVGGPIAEKIGMNSGQNCFGPGNRANATIGRALRLLQLNNLQQRPGFYERSDMGRPEKYTFCIAEQPDTGPWPQLHEEMGCEPGSSGVTVFGGTSAAYFADLTSSTRERFLLGVARRMAGLHISRFGLSSQVVVFNPDSFDYLVAGGWTKQAVREFLHEHATKSLATLKSSAFCRTTSVGGHSTREPIQPGDENIELSITAGPEAILIAVAGGYTAKKATIIPSIDEYIVENVPSFAQLD